MKPFDEMQLPNGSTPLEITLPPYPLLEFAMQFPVHRCSTPYFVLTMNEGGDVYQSDGRTSPKLIASPTEPYGYGLLQAILSDNLSLFSIENSLLFDLFARKVYLLNTSQQSTDFLDQFFSMYSDEFTAIEIILEDQQKELETGITAFDCKEPRVRILNVVEDWYETEKLRNLHYGSQIIENNNPMATILKKMEGICKEIQDIQIIVRDAVYQNLQEHGEFENDFLRGLDELKDDLAYLETYYKYEGDFY